MRNSNAYNARACVRRRRRGIPKSPGTSPSPSPRARAPTILYRTVYIYNTYLIRDRGHINLLQRTVITRRRPEHRAYTSYYYRYCYNLYLNFLFYIVAFFFLWPRLIILNTTLSEKTRERSRAWYCKQTSTVAWCGGEQ